MKTTKWDIYEELKAEEDIQAFVEAFIAEAETDTDPSLLARALGVASKARDMLPVSRDTGIDHTSLFRSFVEGGDPPISAFDKAARSTGYNITLVPLPKRPEKKEAVYKNSRPTDRETNKGNAENIAACARRKTGNGHNNGEKKPRV